MAEFNISKHITTTIDDSDLEFISNFPWYALMEQDGSFSAVIEVMDDETTLLKDIATILLDPPEGYSVHHKDGDRLNNTRSNLEVRKSEGQLQLCRPIFLRVDREAPWFAIIEIDGERRNLGSFVNIDALLEAWREMAERNYLRNNAELYVDDEDNDNEAALSFPPEFPISEEEINALVAERGPIAVEKMHELAVSVQSWKTWYFQEAAA
jgi:hypothetical protein